MTNSELFTAAHKLAKTFEGDYRACFALALQEIRASKSKVYRVLSDREFSQSEIMHIYARAKKVDRFFYTPEKTIQITEDKFLCEDDGTIAVYDEIMDMLDEDSAYMYYSISKKDIDTIKEILTSKK